ncbi:uncharacterized protein SPSK_10495 [Sporothrix schenckii 1099-18]|uniref:EthD domain-containing protein n=1 Tax=Sporothrix schenckii 1099-18 TaxID=1397361 RepID=A0A0F2MBK2_SPOSC|nr:uncharacterized protein SPSK_10495 [Sporothrix schenckii 1099-18]KJR86220.1 hypothetical protein SPSK_10495 [Sporothrix schenckii 1099-18]
MARTIPPIHEDETFYRVMTFFKRRPDITEKQCHDHWRFVYGPLVVPWAFKLGISPWTLQCNSYLSRIATWLMLQS